MTVPTWLLIAIMSINFFITICSCVFLYCLLIIRENRKP